MRVHGMIEDIAEVCVRDLVDGDGGQVDQDHRGLVHCRRRTLLMFPPSSEKLEERYNEKILLHS